MDNMTVKLESFSGPLDLLYHLIEKNEIDIYDIPIAELTDQYIEFINLEENKNMDGMSEFIVMAATLIEIKSRMLLPKPETEEQEEDPREELVQRLIEYKKYKSVVDLLKLKSEEAAQMLFREPDIIIPELMKKEEATMAESLKGVTIEGLYKAFRDVMIRKERKTDKIRSGFNSVRHDSFTVDEKILALRDTLKVSPKIKFYDMFSADSTREEILVTFLALLELIRRNSIEVEQDDVFGDITISVKENANFDIINDSNNSNNTEEAVTENTENTEGGEAYENE